jgi:hypothetical protein
MTFVVAWIVFPLVLALLCLGCGLLLEIASTLRLPNTLLLPGGFIVISIATYFAHMTSATARLATPLVVGLAIAGYVVAKPWNRFQFDRWLALVAAAIYAVFAAPVALAGTNFAGYIKLDDTATFMSFLDRAQTSGYGAANLAPSTYKATLLHEGYKFGYPLGAMLPLDVGQTLLRVDQLWLWQPYLTFMAVLTGLGLFELASGMVQSRALRACVAFIGAQAALLYGYALWGGVKEVFAPAVILFVLCLVPRVKSGTPRQVIPLAAGSAAVIGALSVGGGIWLVPMLVVGVTLLVLYRSTEDALKTVGVYAVTTLGLALPILVVSQSRVNVLGKFLKSGKEGFGNLNHSLSWWQLFGIWPSGDFRGTPSHATLVHILILVVALAAIFAAVMAWRRGRWEIVAALATGIFACLVYVGEASAWVAGKALASSSPLILGVGLVGVAVAIEAGRRTEEKVAGGVVLALVGIAVLWSNALQYQGVLLAPSARLMELEKIGHTFSGKGPALLTEYEPYAVRHFLRGLDADNSSGLRIHQVCLRHPGPCFKEVATNGSSPDLDEIRLDQVLAFKTLITRRTGVTSRPPSVYDLAPSWSGHYYDVWRKNPNAPAIIEHLSLGSRYEPAAVPACKDVMRLAHLASAAHGRLATVIRPEDVVIQPDGTIGPPTHIPHYYGEPMGELYGTQPFARNLQFTVKKPGKYGVWVGGSFSSSLTAKLDGQRIGQQRNQTEWPGNFLFFGSRDLKKGNHMLFIKHRGPDWHPGSGAIEPFGLGPFVIAQGTERQDVTYVQPKDAHSLCGKSLDWIEALRGN